jgi:hypothetical protein
MQQIFRNVAFPGEKVLVAALFHLSSGAALSVPGLLFIVGVCCSKLSLLSALWKEFKFKSTSKSNDHES